MKFTVIDRPGRRQLQPLGQQSLRQWDGGDDLRVVQLVEVDGGPLKVIVLLPSGCAPSNGQRLCHHVVGRRGGHQWVGCVGDCGAECQQCAHIQRIVRPATTTPPDGSQRTGPSLRRLGNGYDQFELLAPNGRRCSLRH